MKINPARRLRWLLLLLVLTLALRTWVVMPMLIVGESMAPTFHGGQVALVNKLTYCFHSPQRGEVVAVWTGEEIIIKRVIGLPGEEICVRAGKVYINNRPLREPYVQGCESFESSSGRMPINHFVVAGDNRANTLVAVVNSGRIIGPITILRPPSFWSHT